VNCGASIPLERKVTAKYCSGRCGRKAARDKLRIFLPYKERRPYETQVHLLRDFDIYTRHGSTYCGFEGLYKMQGKYHLFDGFRGSDEFDGTTVRCEVTCAKCTRYIRE
jgi:hypothetical protein